MIFKLIFAKPDTSQEHKEIELDIQQFTYLCFGPCFTKFEIVFWMVWDGSMKILLSYKWILVKINKVKHHCCCLAAKLCLTLLQPHGLLPTRLLCPWDFPGKNTEVSCHFFLPRGSSQPRDQTCISCTGRWILYHWATREAYNII